MGVEKCIFVLADGESFLEHQSVRKEIVERFSAKAWRDLEV